MTYGAPIFARGADYRVSCSTATKDGSVPSGCSESILAASGQRKGRSKLASQRTVQGGAVWTSDCSS